MNILVITRSAWRNDNSIGNTLSDIFGSMDEARIYGLCFRDEPPHNDIMIMNYAVSERQLIDNLVYKKSVGIISCEGNMINSSAWEKKTYDRIKKRNVFMNFLTIGREALWLIGNWKNGCLIEYIETVKPDIVFMPVFGCLYPHKMLKLIQEYSQSKIVLFHADDNYSLRQFSLSPLYWLYRFRLRHWVRNSVRLSSINYVISEIQKKEYEKAFEKPCKVLTKGGDFSGEPPLKRVSVGPLKLVFTGNIAAGRWRTLAILGDEIQRLNSGSQQFKLYIYTTTPLTKKMRKALSGGPIHLMGSAPASEIKRIQLDADILVHAEGFRFRDGLQVHQSFSTKIVDYMASGRCILALGRPDTASIAYLAYHSAALIATSRREISACLQRVINELQILNEMAQNAWLCGKRHHCRDTIHDMLLHDFKQVTSP